MNGWYKLDNVAKLFPSVTGIKNSSVFRVSAVLTVAVDKEILQKTVDYVYDRFPMLFLKMHKGVFWNYFDNNSDKFLIQEETDSPCGHINQLENNGYFIKVLYFHQRISVELFHSLTDGSGAVEFLKTILLYYLRFSGHDIDGEDKVIQADRAATADEMEDSFFRYNQKGTSREQKVKRSYRVRGTPFEVYGNNTITGVVSASELNKLAKSKNATITSYLVSVLIYSIYKASQKYTTDSNPIIVSVPVNLRRAFPSKTLRNFFAVADLGMRVSATTRLDNIIEEIGAQLREKTQKSALQEMISNNVKYENNILSRFVPLFLKKIFITIGFNFMGEMKKTITLSNVGNISVPTGFSSHVRLMEAVLYPTPKSPVNCGVCSVNDRLSISFSRTIIEADVIRFFMNYLSENDGLDVTVYSNDWGKERA